MRRRRFTVSADGWLRSADTGDGLGALSFRFQMPPTITVWDPTPQSGAPAATDATRTPASPSYTVNLSSDAGGVTWTGHETADFTNASA
jgi:hypothetical protein